MDDNPKHDLRIDTERIPVPEQTGKAIPIINTSTVLVLVGFCAIMLRLLGMGEDIIELGFAIGFLIFVKYYSSRLNQLETQILNEDGLSTCLSQAERYANWGKNLMGFGFLLAIPILLILEIKGNRVLDPYEPWSILAMPLGLMFMITGFVVWFRNR